MLLAFLLFVYSLSNTARSDFNDNMGCRKGYYAIPIAPYPAKCKKCSDIKSNHTEFEFCKVATASVNELSSTGNVSGGILTFVSQGAFNCMYENGECKTISCPDFALGMDELEDNIREMYFKEIYGGEDEFRKFCHYHGCMSAYDKGRCSAWAGWAFGVFAIGIPAGIVILCIVCCCCCCRSNTNKGCNTQTQQLYPSHHPISFPQQQTHQQQISFPQQQTYQQIYPPQNQGYPTPSMLSQSIPSFSAIKDNTWVVPLFASFSLPPEATMALASNVEDMLRTETFTGKDAEKLWKVFSAGCSRRADSAGKGPYDFDAVFEAAVEMYSLETSLYKEMRQGMEEPPAVQKLSQEIDLAIEALSSSKPTAVVPNIAVKLVMMPLMPMYAAGRLAPFAMLLDLALTFWKGPRCGSCTVFHGTQVAKGSLAKRLDAYRHALANNSLVRMSRYISASHKMDIAVGFATNGADRAGRAAILLVIQTVNRPEISAVSMYTGEEEVLFRTNTFMRVTGVGVERGIPAVYLEDVKCTFEPLSEEDWVKLGDLVIMPPSREYIRSAHTCRLAGFYMGLSLMMWLSNKRKGGYEIGTRKQAATIVYYGYNPDVDDDVGRECARAFLGIVNELRMANKLSEALKANELPDSIFPVMYEEEEGDDLSKFDDKFMRWNPVRTLFTFVDTTPGSSDYELINRILKNSIFWKGKGK